MRTGKTIARQQRHRTITGRGLRPRLRGFTYIGILITIAIMGAFLAAIGVVWHTAQQRLREQQLLFVGDQFRQAIADYYNAGGGGAASQYPQTLNDLLRDPRMLGVARYLRKLYHDPITGTTDWGLVKTAGDRIMGVYSLSEAHPIKRSHFNTADREFEGKEKYTQWTFVYQPVTPDLPGDNGSGQDASTDQAASQQWSSSNY